MLLAVKFPTYTLLVPPTTVITGSNFTVCSFEARKASTRISRFRNSDTCTSIDAWTLIAPLKNITLAFTKI